MIDAIAPLATPLNEPVLTYAPGSPERAALLHSLAQLSASTHELPSYIDGEAIHTGSTFAVRSPHKHQHVLGHAHAVDANGVQRAIGAAIRAQHDWAALPYTSRAAIFLRAAELLATRYRSTLNAATMLGQSKTAHQAEIDAACELVDFWRFNAHFAAKILAEQPLSSPGIWNILDHRPLEGFVFAITPFNFTAIAGNLCAAPALMGNTVVWKPADTQAFSAHFIMKILREAGLPPGVINLVYGDGPTIGAEVLAHPSLAGVHFTGSTAVFNHLWHSIGTNIARYRTYPRIVGETGGKDFVLAHRSADVDALSLALVRGAFEFQGQKCSAASRAYVPASLWPAVRERITAMIAQITVGDVSDLSHFMGAVIDKRAFDKHASYLALGKGSPDQYTLIAGGDCDDSVGWFVKPTVFQSHSPHSRLMSEEIFGPILTVFVYPDEAADSWDAVMKLVDQTSPYALTGAVFANERYAVQSALKSLRQCAGNFYINDKPTGAVVGQQPFGGARSSGTNDKAGSPLNLLRWVSPRVIKETLAPPVGDFSYPFMREK
jgi:1-pyrroline-5-carboxylate dehydrogenase